MNLTVNNCLKESKESDSWDICLPAYAKLNLVLDLKFKRPDGYHEVEFVMQEIDLHDTLFFKTANNVVLTCSDPEVKCDEQNLVFKTITLIKDQLHISEKGIHVFHDKKIPHAGGLGGFSAAVAVTIKALNTLWKLELSQAQMIHLASMVGMDCAFSIVGGTCLAKGRGDEVSSIQSPPELNIVIFSPTVLTPPNKTAWIYKNFDLSKITQHPSILEMIEAIKTQSPGNIASCLGNAFEQGLSIPEYTPVFSLLNSLRADSDVLGTIMAGSGPALFAIARTEASAHAIAKRYESSQVTTWVTHSIMPQIY